MQRIPRAPFGNQVEPVPERNAWAVDESANWWLGYLLDRVEATDLERAHAQQLLRGVGLQVGSTFLRDAADTANRNEPQFVAGNDPRGTDDEIRFDPSWDACIDAVCASGVCAIGGTDERAGWIVRAAAMEQWARLDIGVMCPVTMTSAAVPLLVRARELGSEFAGLLVDRIAAAAEVGASTGAYPLVGMAMTEPQGGSDLAGSTVQAVVADDGAWELSGHKWFCSHPTSDALLVLARDPEAGEQAEGTRALSCFLVPGWDPRDGSRNGIVVQRLKDKLGTRSLASAEVVFDRTRGERIGEAGRGVATIMQMVVGTRMDCAIGSAGLMARALEEVVHFAQQRSTFGARLIEQPLMRTVIADLLLEREAALALAFEVARGVQMGGRTSGLVTAAAKYWITRRAVSVCIESVEALGGNGYTEEFVLARLYRDAQVNSTWEGAGNVMALDVLRSLARDPQLHDAFVDDVECLVHGADGALANDVLAFARAIEVPASEAGARRYAGRVALALQAALLVRRATTSTEASDAHVAAAFIATRLAGSPERVFGDGGAELAAAADDLIVRYAATDTLA